VLFHDFEFVQFEQLRAQYVLIMGLNPVFVGFQALDQAMAVVAVG